MPAGQGTGSGGGATGGGLDRRDLAGAAGRLQSDLNSYINQPGPGGSANGRNTPPNGGGGNRGGMLSKNLSPSFTGKKSQGNAAVGGEVEMGGMGADARRGFAANGGLSSYSIGSSEEFDIEDANHRITAPKVGLVL